MIDGMDIDWEEQWAVHAPNFTGGRAKVVLPSGKAFYLVAGPGFGDCSHPTTRLMLQMMTSEVKGRHVVDIGCGSGVLSMAAHHLGAASITSLDIDPLAIEHTRKNAALNGAKISTQLKTFPPNPLILLNMITSEQEIALASLPPLPSTTLITSGILTSQLPTYLKMHPTWKIESQMTENNWIAIKIHI